jgi:Zn-dependent protease with chaperone function
VNYPLDRRLRDAVLIRRLDEGRPVYPTLSRFGYVMLQLRLQVLLMLVPLLLIVALAEAVEQAIPGATNLAGFGWREVATLGAAAGVFLFSPLLARYILDVEPLPMGEVRDDLAAVCAAHRVRVRDMLLWNTNGSMINAAVMGLVSPLRYVMLTDALLESLGREQVVAVMAHEVGHVRRHHMPWMVACLLASFVVAWVPVEMAFLCLTWTGMEWTEDSAQWMSLIGSGVELVGGLLIFGWVCRRFERQADTFAVQHLACDSSAAAISTATGDATVNPTHTDVPTEPSVTPQAALALCSALELISELNNVDPERPSWRHGSIAWRQRYLMSLIGRPANRLPIDRLVRRLKVAAALLVIGGVTLETWRMQRDDEAGDRATVTPTLVMPTIERPLKG